MSQEEKDKLSQRLDRLGMRMEGDKLSRAAAIVHAHGGDTDAIGDMALMSICVEAYRHPDKETLKVV
jgi:allophanate hydrolase subunit 2